MIDRLHPGPWEPHHYGMECRQYKSAPPPLGRTVMPAGIVRRGIDSSPWLWFSHGFYGDARTLEAAKGFVDTIIKHIQAVEISGDIVDSTPPPPPPPGPRLVPRNEGSR